MRAVLVVRFRTGRGTPWLQRGVQVRLVQEFCDQGSLRDKLSDKAFISGEARGVRATGGGGLGPSAPHPRPLQPRALPATPQATTFWHTPPAPRRRPHAQRRIACCSGYYCVAKTFRIQSPSTSPAPVFCCTAAPPYRRADAPPAGGHHELDKILDTAIDIARAVAHLHREGIVHADLKPRNVLLQGSKADRRGFVAKVRMCPAPDYRLPFCSRRTATIPV